jgi:hypothetical protein
VVDEKPFVSSVAPIEETKVGSFEEELENFKKRAEALKPFPKDEVIILGMGHTRKRCPFDAEVWSVNMGYQQIAMLKGHVEKIFMAHRQTRDPYGRKMFFWEHFNKLAEAGVEIWNIHRVKGLNSRLYPLKRLMKKYGTDYFSNTISYMIVWAIEKGYKKIRLYGVDMMTQQEYGWEKGGLEYWIGYARGRGLTVEICEDSQLLRTITGKPYGIKYWRLKDIDPFGLLRRKRKNLPSDSELIEATRSTQPKLPPQALTPWVEM